MRIVICGEGIQLADLLEGIKYRDDIEVLYCVEICKTRDYYRGFKVIETKELSNMDNIDYAVVTADKYANLKHHISMYIDIEKVVNHVDFLEEIISQEAVTPYDSGATVDGLRFIFDKKDKIIGPYIKMRNQIFAHGEIEAFLALTKKYYGYTDGGSFVDVGANIGTTSIYVQKKLSNTQVVAIEPSIENYKVLKSNCFINGMESIRCMNVALSDIRGRNKLRFFRGNPGASALIGDGRHYSDVGVPVIEEEIEDIVTITLEEALEMAEIDCGSVKYLWIDTQGFEPKIINGARTLLSNNSIALFQEFNPSVYIENHEWEMYIDTITQLYSSFISYDEYSTDNYMVRDIDTLGKYWDEMQSRYLFVDDLFFIK